VTDRELNVNEYRMAGEAYWDAVADAIDLASDQDTTTWLTDNGKRIAAIVPVDVAERAKTDPRINRDEPNLFIDSLNRRPFLPSQAALDAIAEIHEHPERMDDL
jgi:hypothetical protein